jgi:hypothetical protein
MNALPFIALSYAAGILVPAALAIAAWTRLRRAERRLATVDPRPRRQSGGSPGGSPGGSQ